MFLAFVMLKVASVGVIGGWPWWIILAPIWLPSVMAVVLICIAIIVKIFIGLRND
jgi:hypothetical protein